MVLQEGLSRCRPAALLRAHHALWRFGLCPVGKGKCCLLSYSLFELILILVGAFIGGFVSGLTGFGTALTAIPLWVQVLPPATAGALAAAASVLSQVQTLHLIRKSIVWRRVLPFILAGLVGVPVGTWLLPWVPLTTFKLGIGIVLVVYCGFYLIADRLAGTGTTARGGAAADAAIGFGAGVMGGIAALSGPLVIMWATFKPWSRDEKRALFQTFNFSILLASLISSLLAGLLPVAFWYVLAMCLPVTYVGTRVGSAVYRRLDNRRFDRLVVSLLFVTGASLIVSNV
jgi:uncharacterized membrane protein YfcA